ncbi:hypothetical protein AAKU67_001897 [Oxalobacteraceae bacterium GrIS 2.11]
MEPRNSEDAREAYMRHVFGDMIKLESQIIKASQLIKESIFSLEKTKSTLATETEKLLLKSLDEIAATALSLSGSEKRIFDVSASAARSVLLGESGPVSQLNELTDRMFAREVESTKWLKKAVAQAEKFWRYVLISSVIGGVVGGLIVRFL